MSCSRSENSILTSLALRATVSPLRSDSAHATDASRRHGGWPLMPKFSAGASPRLRATHALPLATLMLLAVLFGTPGRHDGPSRPRPVAPARPGHPALASPTRQPAQRRRSRCPKSCAASTSRGKRPRPRRPRVPAASPAIKDSTTRTRNRRPSGSVASTATVETRKPPTSKRLTCGRGFPTRGEARATRSDPTRS